MRAVQVVIKWNAFAEDFYAGRGCYKDYNLDYYIPHEFTCYDEFISDLQIYKAIAENLISHLIFICIYPCCKKEAFHPPKEIMLEKSLEYLLVLDI